MHLVFLVACHKLADFFETKKRRLVEAYDQYMENCFKRDYGDSCFKAGQMAFHGTGREKNVEEATKAHKKGCEVNNFNGGCCDTIGMQYLKDTLEPEIKNVLSKPNPKKAVELFKKGCEKDGFACLHAAQIYRDGLDIARVKPDPELMFKYAFRACEFRYKSGCKMVADAYKTGTGTQQDDKLYAQYQNMYELMSGQSNIKMTKKNKKR
ncbi:cytochrome c oxidase assembly factor 7-like [Ruditapes philippinarum]|uniref:cytochrome c oxidase assembly factor 7-like n=1 Tax=Ruditapes philippinarum TaxID=129788 RepID=UPI00295ADC0D|nr:cytochrome c oxidase assembly factor 7-like [Ruditapes philippinarum]